MREKRGMFSSTCKNKKSQASIEYLMIAGFAFIIVIPMMYILYDYTTSLSKDVAESRISKAGNDLVNAAEQIYYLGPPSRTTLRFEMPETVQDIEIIDKAIIFSVGDISAPRKLTIFSKVDIISFLTPNDWAKGRHDYKIEADGTHVIIYTGDRETALMKATAYNFFKELMRQAELIDSADP
ncbi:MAG: hypothetical protein KKE20_07130, partial [Nanoarchaeota archaeon]|nr:hypothetical protein [Nanoarchaeota archaeon]